LARGVVTVWAICSTGLRQISTFSIRCIRFISQLLVKCVCKILLDRVSWRVVCVGIVFFTKVCQVLVGFKNCGCVSVLICLVSGFHLELGETGCSSFEWTSIIAVCSISLHPCTLLLFYLLICQKLNLFN